MQVINIEPIDLNDSGDSEDTDEYSDGEPHMEILGESAQFSVNMIQSQSKVSLTWKSWERVRSSLLTSWERGHSSLLT